MASPTPTSIDNATRSTSGAGDKLLASSASNARDYQARRGNMRFKRAETKKNEYLHTLNASGLATSRLMPALVEQMQQEDGSVLVPQVLQKWVGTELLTPAGK